jgi:hypothetical protein
MSTDTLPNLAKQFLQDESEPGASPEELVDGFCVWLKSEALSLSDWPEDEWIAALCVFGIPPESTASGLEQVAAWGVDD